MKKGETLARNPQNPAVHRMMRKNEPQCHKMPLHAPLPIAGGVWAQGWWEGERGVPAPAGGPGAGVGPGLVES